MVEGNTHTHTRARSRAENSKHFAKQIILPTCGTVSTRFALILYNI